MFIYQIEKLQQLKYFSVLFSVLIVLQFLFSCQMAPLSEAAVCEVEPKRVVCLSIDTFQVIELNEFPIYGENENTKLSVLMESERVLNSTDLRKLVSRLNLELDSYHLTLFAVLLYSNQTFIVDTNFLENESISGALAYYISGNKLFCHPYEKVNGVFKGITPLSIRVDGIFSSDYSKAIELFDGLDETANIILIGSNCEPIRRPRWVRRFLADDIKEYLAKTD